MRANFISSFPPSTALAPRNFVRSLNGPDQNRTILKRLIETYVTAGYQHIMRQYTVASRNTSFPAIKFVFLRGLRFLSNPGPRALIEYLDKDSRAPWECHIRSNKPRHYM